MSYFNKDNFEYLLNNLKDNLRVEVIQPIDIYATEVSQEGLGLPHIVIYLGDFEDFRKDIYLLNKEYFLNNIEEMYPDDTVYENGFRIIMKAIYLPTSCIKGILSETKSYNYSGVLEKDLEYCKTIRKKETNKIFESLELKKNLKSKKGSDEKNKKENSSESLPEFNIEFSI